MKLVLPIAGRGSRFKSEAVSHPEYLKPKPLIEVRGYPMVRFATGSLPFVEHLGQHLEGDQVVRGQDIIFVALQEHAEQYHMVEHLKAIYGDQVRVVLIPEVTRGAAETVLAAKAFINSDEPLLISDSDHFFDGAALAKGIAEHPGIGGIIPVFQVPEGDTKWSFSRTGPDGYVDLVAEKQPISRWANIGAYYFGKGSDFVSAATEMVEHTEYVNREFYIAPLYNKLIAKGKKIKNVFPGYVYGLGTPADLEYFLTHTTFKL